MKTACDKARAINSVTVCSIHSILTTGFDQLSLPVPSAPFRLIEHKNSRGKRYYDNESVN